MRSRKRGRICTRITSRATSTPSPNSSITSLTPNESQASPNSLAGQRVPLMPRLFEPPTNFQTISREMSVVLVTPLTYSITVPLLAKWSWANQNTVEIECPVPSPPTDFSSLTSKVTHRCRSIHRKGSYRKDTKSQIERQEDHNLGIIVISSWTKPRHPHNSKTRAN